MYRDKQIEPTAQAVMNADEGLADTGLGTGAYEHSETHDGVITGCGCRRTGTPACRRRDGNGMQLGHHDRLLGGDGIGQHLLATSGHSALVFRYAAQSCQMVPSLSMAVQRKLVTRRDNACRTRRARERRTSWPQSARTRISGAPFQRWHAGLARRVRRPRAVASVVGSGLERRRDCVSRRPSRTAAPFGARPRTRPERCRPWPETDRHTA